MILDPLTFFNADINQIRKHIRLFRETSLLISLEKNQTRFPEFEIKDIGDPFTITDYFETHIIMGMVHSTNPENMSLTYRVPTNAFSPMHNKRIMISLPTSHLIYCKLASFDIQLDFIIRLLRTSLALFNDVIIRHDIEFDILELVRMKKNIPMYESIS